MYRSYSSMSLLLFDLLNEVGYHFCILKYVYDVVVKSSRSLSHLMMSFLYLFVVRIITQCGWPSGPSPLQWRSQF